MNPRRRLAKTWRIATARSRHSPAMLFAHHVRPVFIVALACIFFFVFWSYSSTPSSAYLTSARPPSSWTFNSSIHSRIHTLNKEQCQSSFGDLLESVSAAAKRRGSHPIQLNDLDIEQGRCMLRALLFEGEVHDDTPFQSREKRTSPNLVLWNASFSS